MHIRPLQPIDGPAWRALYEGYRSFYDYVEDPRVTDRVWGWLLDAGHEEHGVVAVDEHGVVQGIAHFRRFSRPASGTTGLWLDDLFVAAPARGGGVARALLQHLVGIADDEGLSVVRWITAAGNATARRLYDDVATATEWVTYDMRPDAARR